MNSGAFATIALSAGFLESRIRRRIAVKTLAAFLGKLVFVAAQVGPEQIPVSLTAFHVAEGVQLQRRCPRQLQFGQDVLCQRDNFHIGLGRRHAQQFDTDLVELALTALLRAFVAEHRSAIKEFQRCLLRKAAGDKRARDARGTFGTQGNAFAALGLKSVHLFGDDIGGVAQRAREDVGELEHRRNDFAVAIARGDIHRRRFYKAVPAYIVEQKIVGAANRLKTRQGCNSI